MISDNYAQTHKRNRVLSFLIMIPLLGLIGWAISEWSEQPGSYEVRQGQRILYQMAGSQTLEKAGFFDMYPDGRPSDFVRYVGSSRGDRLWPESQAQSNDKPSSIRSRGNRLLKPADLRFSAYERTVYDKPQVVYSPDDANNQLVLRGFDPGKDKPVYEYRFDFPTDAGEIDLD